MTRFALLCIALGVLAAPCNSQTGNIRFYVSPSGNDQWSGTLASPNTARSDGPFATFERARKAVRDARSESPQRKGQIHVSVRGGAYRFSNPLRLDASDSGEYQNPIVWQSYNSEPVIVSGSVPVKKFQSVTDQTVVSKLSSGVRNLVMVADLKSQGISDYGEISQRGSPGIELFYKGTRMVLARWPNAEWLRIADVPQTGERQFNKGLDREKRFDGVPVGRHYGRIRYEGERPRGWSNVSEILAHGYWTWDWSDSYQRIQ